ncbi:Cytochrome c oxidase assembly protein cox11, mitochondrial [Tulasnella sp. 419]|nr:Cytochrome c oxidase assembly protein cox11, mitochondrial [Tulasnella sp. 418]KAG8970528.1 Cytochrome c oxidase assembly protein cox11, mitochondrial [Tulasnella sp. 419]
MASRFFGQACFRPCLQKANLCTSRNHSIFRSLQKQTSSDLKDHAILTLRRNVTGAAPGPRIRPPGPSPQDIYKSRNRTLLLYTSAVILFISGASYAAVPTYRAFCGATGYNGTPMTTPGRFTADRLVPVTEAKSIKVHFNADKSAALPWSFTPQQKYVVVKPGETSLAFYTAKNNSSEDIIGIATYNVTPGKVAPYFSKVECFCFEEQKLLAGEEVDMPLLFFIDKDCLEDESMKDVDDVVLSYTFFKARRNSHGHLEPDAPHSVVQASQGFEDFPSIDPSKPRDEQLSVKS